MGEVKCTIPADMLRYTVSALDELAIRKKMQAEKAAIPAVAENLLKEVEKVLETANFYHELYMQREVGT